MLENGDKLMKKTNDYLQNMFSNIKLRILSAQKYNPTNFENVTLIIDGIDHRINYVNTDIKKARLYSHKLKRSGLRTQIVSDMNDMIIFISKSEYCSDSSDGSMFLNMKLYNKLHEGDCIAMDGGYNLFINKFLELSEEKGFTFGEYNFQFPIRKKVNEPLSNIDQIYNDTFGSFRSKIEDNIGKIGNTFKKFNNNKNTPRIDKVKHFNLQFKMVCLLKNIRIFTEKFGIEPSEYHKQWADIDFQFPEVKTYKEIIVKNHDMVNINAKKMKEVQKNILSLKNVNNKPVNINSASEDESMLDISEDDVPKFNEKKRKKSNKKKINIKYSEKYRTRTQENVYEIENIVSHCYDKDNNILFLVKWKNYPDNENSYIDLDAFLEKDILEEYCTNNNINI